MLGNSFGYLFRLTTFGESHGVVIGGVIDGCPSNLELNFDEIQYELNRRKPGQSEVTTSRNEDDKVEFLSGIFEGKTLGTPIGFIIRNKNAKLEDYNDIKDVFRPSHADYTYQKKYGIRDYRGGGRSSARETACRVVAGAIAKQFLCKYDVKIQAYVSQIGHVKCVEGYKDLDLSLVEKSIVRCPDLKTSKLMVNYINQLKKEGDSTGGKITCIIEGTPIGLGEPVFDKLHAQLGKAMLSINAVKGFEYGSGFGGVAMKGSEHNDEFYIEKEKVKTKTNYSGGIQGGISNGEDIYFNVAFKPVATIRQKQKTVNISGDEKQIEVGGRHDACVVPRAVPIVEAMAALVLMDFVLLKKH